MAEAATHLAIPAVYMDVGDMPGPALVAAVAREVTPKLFSRGHGTMREILLPGASGLDTLGALSAKLGEQGLVADVVIDNAHSPARKAGPSTRPLMKMSMPMAHTMPTGPCQRSSSDLFASMTTTPKVPPKSAAAPLSSHIRNRPGRYRTTFPPALYVRRK